MKVEICKNYYVIYNSYLGLIFKGNREEKLKHQALNF